MASKRLLVELYYDVISPYSYLGFEALCRYRKPWDMELKFKPFYLGGVMRGASNEPPGLVPNRMRYMFKDISRLSKFYNVKLTFHEEFPEWMMTRSTVKSQRFLCALHIHSPEHVEGATRVFFKRLFGDNKENMSVESIKEVANEAGIPENIVEKCLAAIETDEVKQLLKTHTDEALKVSAFGSPTIVAHIDGKKELFFGQDRLELLAFCAGKKYRGPLSNL